MGRLSIVVAALGMAGLAVLPPTPWHAQSTPADLKLLISTEQHVVTEPYPARLTLQIHNASQHTLWLYHRASAKAPPVKHVVQEGEPVETSGGATLEIAIQPADSKAAQAAATPAQGKALEYIGMPAPKLVKVAAGGDYEERAVLHLTPAVAEGLKPMWGVYRVTVTYAARYSNGEEFQRNVSTPLWQGEVTSNAIDFELRPAPADAAGSVQGSVIGKNQQPSSDVRVSLTDSQEHLIDQQVTGADGSYSFQHLPLALYWVTARREAATEDTSVFHSVELTSAAPQATDRIDLTPQEVYVPQKVQHKPVLFKVIDASGKPAEKVLVDATWSNGTVLDDVKATTDNEGTALMELIPGRNFVTLKRHGCHDQDERADIALGPGVESFKMEFECGKK